MIGRAPSQGSGLSRYALKNSLEVARRDVSGRYRQSIVDLKSQYKRWLDHQRASVGRAVPQTRTEEIVTELMWLRGYKPRKRKTGF